MTTCKKPQREVLTKGKQYRLILVLNGLAFVKTDRHTFGWFPVEWFQN